MIVRFSKVFPSAIIPQYQSDKAAGMDLYARLGATIDPGEAMPVPTGVAIALPEGHVGLIVPRSGIVRRVGVTVANSPGIIDEDYRGEIVVLMRNHGVTPWHFAAEYRIAQLVVVPVARVEIEVVDELPPPARGEGGFGSTGV